MSGPAAQQAQRSHFFHCDKENSEATLPGHDLKAVVQDPLDASCITAYLQDPTQEGCTSAVDQDGNACEWCSLAGLTNVCLTSEQAEQGASLGITCDASARRPDQPIVVDSESSLEDPYDPACMLAYVRDPTQEGCTSGVDQDGAPCQFCTWMGFDLCLTAEQVQMGQAAGISCSAETASSGNVADLTCLKDFWTLHDAQPADCDALVDADDQSCQYCTLQVQNGLPLCLSSEQAALAAQVAGDFVSCSSSSDAGAQEPHSLGNDMLDPSCWTAYVQGGGTSDACTAAKDEDGAPCQYCTRDAVRHVCATSTQADLLSGLGFWCEDGNNKIGVQSLPNVAVSSEREEVALPDDFLECLQHYQEDDCAPHGCTWCSTQVGVAFCTSNAVADAMKECTFFDCQYKQEVIGSDANVVEDVEAPLGSICMTAGFHNPENAEHVCASTKDESGTPCVWCHSQDNVVGLCFSVDQAAKASAILQCDGASVDTIANAVLDH